MAGGGAQRVGEVVLEDGGGFCWTSPSGAGRTIRGIKINTWQYGVCVYITLHQASLFPCVCLGSDSESCGTFWHVSAPTGLTLQHGGEDSRALNTV